MRNWKFTDIDFSSFPNYLGDDLGVIYSNLQLNIKIWAPTAKNIQFRLYEKSSGGEAIRIEDLIPSASGVWQLKLKGQLKGLYYSFQVNDGEWLNETPDIYARAVGVNGKRGLICDSNETNPEGWENDQRVVCENPVDAVIYELHIRDFSVNKEAPFAHKGKYLAFTEKGLQLNGCSIGIDHLKELGITHVHLLPVSDFYSVDENHPELKYNWGYDPQNFNCPEGSYATNPDNLSRTVELKQLIQALHGEGIGVIFDVVYNHTGLTRRSVFNQTVPGYFYRQWKSGLFSNASGCGNEIASERAMVRKYIVDSVVYWAKEFHADGFRFDLMGILDIETMNQIRLQLDHISPFILVYGEGWTADKSPLDESHRAVKINTSKLDRIAAFNDDIREAILGNVFDARKKGFVSGLTLREEQLKYGIVAACFHPQIIYSYVESSHNPWAAEPYQSINYASCHDNYSLYDKLVLSSPKATDEELRKMIKLTAAIILTSQGVSFLEGGMEMARTKHGISNSYLGPDSINQIDWTRKNNYRDVYEYFRKLIQLRKEHPAFRMRTSAQIRHHLKFSSFYKPGVVAYSLIEHANGDPSEEILVVFNGNNYPVDFPLEDKKTWQIVSYVQEIDFHPNKTVSGNVIAVPAISALILVR